MPRDITCKELKKYCYWREFLLRSERYEKLCEFINAKKQISPFEDELIYSWCPVITELYKPYIDWLSKNVTTEELQTPFDAETTYGEVLHGIYPLFQDIFNEPFSKVEHRIKLFYELHEGRAIKCAKENLLSLLACSFTKNKMHKSKIRHTKDIYMDFLDYIDGIYGIQIADVNDIICIDTQYPKKEIQNQFNKYLDNIFDKQGKNKRTPEIRPYFTFGNRNFPHFDTCLEAYDIFTGISDLPRKEVIKIAFPKDDEKEHKRLLKNMKNAFAKAERYIKNAEQGVFPGLESNSPKNEKGQRPTQVEYQKIAHLIEVKKQKKIEAGPAKVFPLEDYFHDN